MDAPERVLAAEAASFAHQLLEAERLRARELGQQLRSASAALRRADRERSELRQLLALAQKELHISVWGGARGRLTRSQARRCIPVVVVGIVGKVPHRLFNGPGGSAMKTANVRRAVLFDLDGVLVDARDQHAACVREVAAMLGVVPADDPCRTALLSPGRAARALFPRLDPRVVMRALNSAAAHRAIALVPGVRGVLESLTLRTDLAVVTARNRVDAERMLKGAALRGVFREVVTWGDTASYKPAPAPLLHAMGRLGAVRAMYVGDMPTDMVAARAAGLIAVGAIWATPTPARDLVAAGAAIVLDEPAQLLELVERMETLAN